MYSRISDYGNGLNVEPVRTMASDKTASPPEARKRAQLRDGGLKTESKQKRTALLGVRVTDAELELWDAQNVKTGQLRSAVLRKKLGISVDLPNKRPELSKEAAYDYHRAMLIRMSIDKILLVLQSMLTLKDRSQKEEALERITHLVSQEAKKIKHELDALQLRSGVCRSNPAKELLNLKDEVTANDCNTAH